MFSDLLNKNGRYVNGLTVSHRRPKEILKRRPKDVQLLSTSEYTSTLSFLHTLIQRTKKNKNDFCIHTYNDQFF